MAKKETAIFLTVNGSDTYSLLRNLLAPFSLSTKTVEELFEILKAHLKPQPIVIAERYKFYYRDQKENETISDYIAVLRKLTWNCDFRQFFDGALRDRFVCGLVNGSIRRQLLAERTLTLKIAIDLAKTLESAEVEIKLMNTEIEVENEFATKQKSPRCYQCNFDEHLSKVLITIQIYSKYGRHWKTTLSFTWKRHRLSFENLKQVLLTAPVLTTFDQNIPLNPNFDA